MFAHILYALMIVMCTTYLQAENSLQAWAILDKQQEAVAFQWVTYEQLNAAGQRDELKNVYMAAFKEIYKNYLTDDFVCKLEANLALDMDELQHQASTMLLLACKQQRIVGFAVFKISDQEAILERLGIQPDQWNRGIGKELVFSIKNKVSSIKKIKLVSYKINARSPQFYTALGFKPTEYKHEHYDPALIQGFEYLFSN